MIVRKQFLTERQIDLLLDSIIADVDSYKCSHWLQYPPGTEYVSSYVESRGGEFDKTVFFGLQMFLKKYLSKPITQEEIDAAAILFAEHRVPFNKEGWQYILNKHGGKLPLEIKALPEGTIVKTRNVLVQVVNTDPECFWLTSYIETALLRAIWYPTTVSTLSWSIKNICRQYLEETAMPEAMGGLEYMLHNFGARGVSSKESAGIGDAAHTVHFRGTDTVTGLLYAMKYYNMQEVPAYSVPAAEHSSITTWLKDRELAAYENMLDQFAPQYPVIAIVSDSYDIYNAVRNLWGDKLKDRVIQCGSQIVIRPDSGNPIEVCVELLLILSETYGFVTNEKGYKVINNVRVLQGDGINLKSLTAILQAVKDARFSAENMVFGMGGGLMQQLDRDTLKFAMKASWALIDGQEIAVYKDPVTDPGKHSQRGRLDLYRGIDGEYYTGPIGADNGELELVWRDGTLFREKTFAQVREKVEQYLEAA